MPVCCASVWQPLLDGLLKAAAASKLDSVTGTQYKWLVVDTVCATDLKGGGAYRLSQLDVHPPVFEAQ